MATLKSMLENMWSSTSKTAKSIESPSPTCHDGEVMYNTRIDEIRDVEYPSLVGTIYLDHAGTTPYAKTLIESWTTELTTNLFGNPHSASAASQLSTRRIDDIRLKVLKFFRASPDDFDVVFVANATAAIKLVAEAFRDNKNGFWYGFHADAHTSIVGCRELADRGSTCFQNNDSLEAWMSSIRHQACPSDLLQLVAYPGQSNMSGRKIPMSYCEQIRRNASDAGRRIFTMLDVASLASTSPLDLSDVSKAPDFITLSFYKIFGFPDLGALIVRKESAYPLMAKRYFAGGTVDGVATSGDGWHAKKSSPHSALEEGTLPFHNIVALDHAMDVHRRLFNSMDTISKHSRYLARQARIFLRETCHTNGTHIGEVYGSSKEVDNGPIVAFNLKDSHGNIISASEVEKLCIVKGIQLRTGGLCNPGGIAHYLDLSREQIESNYLSGRRCGGESGLIDGRPTGVIRISFGAMSTKADLHSFIDFIKEYYVEQNLLGIPRLGDTMSVESSFLVKSLSVYPIKSCGAFEVPSNQKWQVTPKGLTWDREWCLVHEGTNVALSQKKYPCMTLLQPTLDLSRRMLIVSYSADESLEAIHIDLDEAPTVTTSMQKCREHRFKLQNSKVCGDTIPIQVYTSATINEFFSKALGVSCCLARYPRDTTHTRDVSIRKPSNDTSNSATSKQPQLMLSNESPILIVSSSSVDELNRQIQLNAQQKGTTAVNVSPSTFRANIVVAQQDAALAKSPYVEDTWTSLTIVSSKANGRPLKPETTSGLVCFSNSSDTHSDTSITNSIPGSFSSDDDHIDPDTNQTTTSDTSSPPLCTSSNISISSPPCSTQPLKLDILGPCQRCQMLSINQATAMSQQEPFSTLVKTRRKGDGRVWFGVHAALAGSEEGVYVQVGDLVVPSRAGT